VKGAGERVMGNLTAFWDKKLDKDSSNLIRLGWTGARAGILYSAGLGCGNSHISTYDPCLPGDIFLLFVIFYLL